MWLLGLLAAAAAAAARKVTCTPIIVPFWDDALDEINAGGGREVEGGGRC